MNLDGAIACNNNENMVICCDEDKNNQFDPMLADTMRFLWWLQIKQCLELINPYKKKEKHEDGYEPTQKFLKVWGVFTFILNAFTKKGGMDITVDETTWPSACYEPMHQRLIMEKASKDR